ncbi:MAG: UDP-N-acetylmuramate dehydrogenase [Candidatus Limivivens sp.]|nr:UDP-N-acetylmuramate dehydrogenase [Candidatus Limivivens sp.]
MNQELWEQLCGIVGSDHTYTNEPMKNHTTFRIGGPADYFVQPHSKAEIAAVIKACRDAREPYFILGNGSNLLVGDKGYRGLVIQIFKNYCDITVQGEEMRVKSGALLSKVARKALEYGLTGFEFAAGIPGTMGGAVYMNAGAYGGEIRDILKETIVLTEELEICTVSREELELGYRTSSVAKNHWLVLEAVLLLRKGNREEIQARMEELKAQRISKQPLDYPSAGSTFKRPAGYFAGKLIMDAGLQGFSVGGAQVSAKHCGFVINTGNATAKDVTELMKAVSDTVYEKFQVRLEPEVRLLGEFT